ncbi:MAG: helix-turn-helix domain-containing protein [Nanoarchaeota archaeon]
MEERAILERVGLSPAEAKVYLTLLEGGSFPAGTIIKKTGLYRQTAYQTLERLMRKGLVSVIRIGKKRHFQAAPPEKLLHVLEEKENLLKGILPDLNLKRELSEEQQDVAVFSGVKGIQTVLENMMADLPDGGEYLDFGVSGLFKEVMAYYWKRWQREKKEKRIRSKCIFSESLRTDRGFFREYVGEFRFHPERYPSFTDTMIYQDRVILLLWTATPILAVVIRNKENAESYKNNFFTMWENSMK